MAYLCFKTWLTASLVSLVYHQNSYYFGEKAPKVLEGAMSCSCDVDHLILHTQLIHNLWTPQDASGALCVTSIQATGSFAVADNGVL